MTVSIVVAMAKNRVIGKKNALPWYLPADLKHFKELTLGKSVIMGQKTFESIGKPLPNRINIVLSRNENFNPPNCVVARSIDKALRAAGSVQEAMIIGGASVYEQFLPRTDRIYLTLIDADFEGDIYFPEINEKEWGETERIENQSDEKNPYKYTFITLQRKK